MGSSVVIGTAFTGSLFGTGAVGSVVGQLAKAWGCRAVGIAGGKAKCAALWRNNPSASKAGSGESSARAEMSSWSTGSAGRGRIEFPMFVAEPMSTTFRSVPMPGR